LANREGDNIAVIEIVIQHLVLEYWSAPKMELSQEEIVIPVQQIILP
jgi:hypothetical protein